jgi:FdhD protein
VSLPQSLPAQRSSTARAEVTAWRDGKPSRRLDTLATEEPLEIRLAGYSVAVTMRTPGDDLDLAAGFLLTEGIIRSMADIDTIGYCPTDDVDSECNIVNVNPVDPALVDPARWQRNFFVTSSCGICGKASIEAVVQEAAPLSSSMCVSETALFRLANGLRAGQGLFDETGGLHAAGLFSAEGEPVVIREDVGRHNATDKVIGWALREGRLPLDGHVLMVSGRASFEIVQKALMAGIPVVAAVSAPSSLAVDLARAMNMTLVGFLRTGDGGGRFNIYSASGRVHGAK